MNAMQYIAVYVLEDRIDRYDLVQICRQLNYNIYTKPEKHIYRYIGVRYVCVCDCCIFGVLSCLLLSTRATGVK